MIADSSRPRLSGVRHALPTFATAVALLVALSATLAKLADLTVRFLGIDRTTPLPLLWVAVPAWMLFLAARRRHGVDLRARDVRYAAITLTAVVPVLYTVRLLFVHVPLRHFEWVSAIVFVAVPATFAAAPTLVERGVAVRLPVNAALTRLAVVNSRDVMALAVLSAVLVWAALNHADPYIGHDEAVYANKARSWLTELPAVGWRVYRPPGLPLLGYVALAVHDSLLSLRLVGLVLTVATLAVYYVVGSRLATPSRAVAAVLVMLSAAVFQRRMPEFLNDIAAAGLLLVVAYLIIRAQQTMRPIALLPAAVVAVIVFYLRYGAISGLVAIAVASAVTYGWRSWARWWRYVLAASAVFVVGLIPHFVYANRSTGSPLGVVLSAGETAGGSYVGQGLVQYAVWFPVRLAGDLGGVVMLTGAISTTVFAWQLVRRRLVVDERWPLLLTVAAGVHVLVLGLAAHAEERYVFFPVMAMVLVGVHGMAQLSRHHSPAVLALVAAVSMMQIVASYGWARAALDGASARRGPVAEAATAASSPPCLIIAPKVEPEVGWHSRCEVRPYWSVSTLPVDGGVAILRYSGAPTTEWTRRSHGWLVGRSTSVESFGEGPERVELIRVRAR